MADVSAILSAVSAFKAATDIGKSMIGLRDAAAFQSKLIDFQNQIIAANEAALAAQDERSALLQNVSKLEKDVASFKAWDARKERYELKKLGYSAFAYMLKKDARGTEPPHCVCTNCFEDERISIIQYTIAKKGEGFVWICPSCKSTIDPHTGTIEWID